MLEKENIDKMQVKSDYLSGIKNKEIADKYGISINTLKCWIKRYKWSEEKKKGCTPKEERGAPQKRKKGAPINNKNAVGNSGGAPDKNDNAVKHGLFSKYMPKESMDIIDAMTERSPLDLIWDAIQIQYAAIIRAQGIMYVKDRSDKTIEKVEEKCGNIIGEKWEVQQAWDKQANFLKAQSKAVDSLKNMVKDYLELEGKTKADASSSSRDWKAAIIEIAKRRAEKNE